MGLSRRELMQFTAGASATAALGQARGAVAGAADFKAMVGVYLSGGHDGWNMVVPTDERYKSYRTGRGALALAKENLLPLRGTPFALHPGFAPLCNVADGGNLSVVLNTGALAQPMTKALYLRRPDLRPRNLMLHDEAEAHWGGEGAANGYLARAAKDSALFVQDTHVDKTGLEVRSTRDAYAVDEYFRGLGGNVARQLHRAARVIEARDALGHARQAFLVSQYGYDTHEEQTATQARLYTDLAAAVAAFHGAMAALGVARDVTTFTMSEFGRTYAPNFDGGSDHGWGNNHLVIGGAAEGTLVRGAYPSAVLGGEDDVMGDGRWLPSLAIEEYLAPIMRWYGVADMTAVFPNWSMWSGAAAA